MDKMIVVVVGGGMSGLTAVKACLEENLSVVCYEKSNHIGGTWHYSETEFSCPKNTVLNNSKEMMAFSDYPFPDDWSNFVSNGEYLQYLNNYAAHFGLNSHIKIEHEVLRIAKGPEFESIGNWKITVKDVKANITKEVIAAKVIVCRGLYSNPHYGTYPGLDSFKGPISHSSQYKTSKQFEGKNVIVVSHGNYAYDIAVDVADVAKKVHVTTTVGLLIISRMGRKGYPYDIIAGSRFHMLKWTYWSGIDGVAKDLLKWCSPGFDRNTYGLPITNFNPMKHLTCVNDRLPYSILCGRILMHSPIERFTPNGVIFQGTPTEHPIDMVILSTGYDKPDLSLIFPNGEIPSQDYSIGFYKQVFPLKLPHQTVAFIGAGRFNFSYGLDVEIQNRWVAAIFSKRLSLPSKEIQEKEIAVDCQTTTDQRIPIILALPYLNRISELLGVRPNFFKLFFTDPKLFYALMFGPFISYQFRLSGPHSWPKARETILTIHKRVRAGFGSRPGIDDLQPQKSKYLIAVKYLLIGGLTSFLAYQVYKRNKYTFLACFSSARYIPFFEKFFQKTEQLAASSFQKTK